jgi:hypothetical protein
MLFTDSFTWSPRRKKEHKTMPQTSVLKYVESLDKAGLLTRFKDEKRVDELPKLMEDNPDTAVFDPYDCGPRRQLVLG